MTFCVRFSFGISHCGSDDVITIIADTGMMLSCPGYWRNGGGGGGGGGSYTQYACVRVSLDCSVMDLSLSEAKLSRLWLKLYGDV